MKLDVSTERRVPKGPSLRYSLRKLPRLVRHDGDSLPTCAIDCVGLDKKGDIFTSLRHCGLKPIRIRCRERGRSELDLAAIDIYWSQCSFAHKSDIMVINFHHLYEGDGL